MSSAPEGTDTPLVIRDLADACVRFVKRALGIELDYSPDTLPILDHYLREAHGVGRDEVLRLIVPAAGAYFGEVVRRHLGSSRWHLEDDDYAATRLEFTRCFVSFNPVGAALETVLGKEAEGYGSGFELLPEDRGLVRDALEQAGDVRADDYYRLSVRYEVVEMVVALLVEKAITKGEVDRTYGADVYAALREQQSQRVLH